MRKAIAALGAIASIFLGGLIEATAQTYQGTQIYRVGNTQMIVANLSPGSEFVAHIPNGKTKVFNVVADACGLASFKLEQGMNESAPIKVNGVARTIEVQDIQNQLVPSCVNGQLSEARTQDFSTPAPSVFDTGRYYIVGLTPGQPYKVEFLTTYVLKRKANACGFVRIANSFNFKLMPDTTFDVQSFSYSGADSFGMLPDAQIAPKCYTVDGTPRLFVPTNW